jgi:hypothetical protein
MGSALLEEPAKAFQLRVRDWHACRDFFKNGHELGSTWEAQQFGEAVHLNVIKVGWVVSQLGGHHDIGCEISLSPVGTARRKVPAMIVAVQLPIGIHPLKPLKVATETPVR